MTLWEPQTSQQEILRALRSQIEARWGKAPTAAQELMAASAANALWLIAQQPLEPLGEEPDFLSIGSLSEDIHG